ncbi:MAG: methyl-accepting chemotaxis protein [Spirochaetaceae bacterium]
MTLKKLFKFGIGGLIFLSISYVVLSGANMRITKGVNDKLSERFLAFSIADEFRHTSMDLTRFARTYAATGLQKYSDDYWAIVNWRGGKAPRPSTVHKELMPNETIPQSEIMKQIGFTDGEFKMLEDIGKMSNDLINLEDQAMKSINKKKYVAGPEKILPGEEYNEFAVRILYSDLYHVEVYKIWGTVNEFVAILDERINGEIQVLKITGGILSVLTYIILVIIIFAVVYIINYILKKLLGGEPEEIMNIVTKVSTGNLDIAFDKLTALGIYGSMKNMCIKLKNVISETKNSSEELEEIGESLSANAEESSASLAQVTTNLSSINGHFQEQYSSVESVTSAITEITSNIESLNESINKQNSQINESSESIEGMVKSIEDVSSNMDEVHNSMGDLTAASVTGQKNIDTSSNQINTVSEESKKLMLTNQVISSIASQTNLLAMNAAIEAAHAGETGKGFSVVADEIRKLAESTTQQSHEVASILKQMDFLISEIVNSSDDTVQSFKVIQSLIKTVSERDDEVRDAMSIQRKESRQVLESLGTMSQITQTVLGGANEIKIGSNLVLDEVLNLKEITAKSSSSISDITTSTEEINMAVENVTEMSLRNREMVKKIAEEMEYFTLDS